MARNWDRNKMWEGTRAKIVARAKRIAARKSVKSAVQLGKRFTTWFPFPPQTVFDNPLVEKRFKWVIGPSKKTRAKKHGKK